MTFVHAVMEALFSMALFFVFTLGLTRAFKKVAESKTTEKSARGGLIRTALALIAKFLIV